MEKYTNESERLRDIAKMFTDTSAVNDFLSEEELDEAAFKELQKKDWLMF